MILKPRAEAKIIELIHRGVDIPNPLTLDIGDEVPVDRVSAKGVTLYPGFRIYGVMRPRRRWRTASWDPAWN